MFSEVDYYFSFSRNLTAFSRKSSSALFSIKSNIISTSSFTIKKTFKNIKKIVFLFKPLNVAIL
jgi:hypothetical protein